MYYVSLFGLLGSTCSLHLVLTDLCTMRCSSLFVCFPDDASFNFYDTNGEII